MTTIIIYTTAGLIIWGGALLVAREWNKREHRYTRHRGPIGLLEIYAYLSLEGRDEEHPLLRHRPTDQERHNLTGIIVELRQTLQECRAERAGELARAWGLDGWLEQRIATTIGRRREEALEWLLYLHPTATCAEHVWSVRLPTRTSIFRQMLIAIYAKPSQVAFYLKLFPYTLTWAEVERVVEVLHMRFPILSPPKVEGVAGCNVEMLLLYLAHVEGVGDPLIEAERLTSNPNRKLRTAAFNVLLGEALFPRLREEGSNDAP